jgi:hypothetical protein
MYIKSRVVCMKIHKCLKWNPESIMVTILYRSVDACEPAC